MYDVKSKIFLEFTKTQKSALCSFLRNLVKKLPNLALNEVLDKFIYDEKYYLEISSSRFGFLKDFLDDENFIKETKLYLSECKKYYDYKKSQAPLIQAQKDFDKKKRKFLQEIKMSKEAPTKKQLYYYKTLCKKYNIETKDEKELSRLDLRNLIDEILNGGK